MEVLQSCRCCLSRPAEKPLQTPFTHLGKTEIYSDMLTECFDIHLSLENEECGICNMCISRLRDACDFKLQVQRIQTELERTLHVEELKHHVKSEIGDEDATTDEFVFELTHQVKSEIDEENATTDEVVFESTKQVKSEIDEEDATTDEVVFDITCGPASGPEEPAQLLLERDETSHVCPTCHNTFKHAHTLSRHLHSKHKTNNIGTRSSTVKDIKLTKKPQKISCEICKKQFRNKSGLNTHKRVHASGKPYKCDVCKKTFAQIRKYYTHMRTHTEKKRYFCGWCNKWLERNYHWCR